MPDHRRRRRRRPSKTTFFLVLVLSSGVQSTRNWRTTSGNGTWIHTYSRIHASQGCHNLFRRPVRLPSRPDDNNQAHLKLEETRPPPPLDGEHSSFPGEPPGPSLEMELESWKLLFPSELHHRVCWHAGFWLRTLGAPRLKQCIHLPVVKFEECR
ncbi:hypothetical protein GQ607_007495 [Colletotrichum asianum]|uniref:Secreted protein n=1 Tax=Colletotrichum asianum TaxID=702518 RepID=A0A8H3WBZ0_9PEZI|nr:hypothetical protein GQ607_007495 [Colletotrichum asianum]